MAALIAIVVGSSAIGIMSGLVAVPEITGVVAMMLGLGVGIDYALFILTRHRQNLASGQSVPVAIGRANATAGLSVLFAGVTVIVAILGLKVSGIPMMAMMGYGSAIMVAVVMLASITLLPAMLGVVKHRVNSARVPFVKPKPAYNPDAASARWAARVVAKPVRYGGVAAVVLGVLAIPVFSMHLGFADAGNDAPDSTTRKAYDLMADGYGPGTNGPLEVVLDDRRGARIPGRTSTRSRPRWPTRPGVASVDAPVTNEAGGHRDHHRRPRPRRRRTRRPASCSSTLREDTLPAALDGYRRRGVGHRLDGADRRRLVAAAGADAAGSSAAVIGLSFLVLMVVFRSVLVPLKAAAAQRARRRSGVRRGRRGLPVGLGRQT